MGSVRNIRVLRLIRVSRTFTASLSRGRQSAVWFGWPLARGPRFAIMASRNFVFVVLCLFASSIQVDSIAPALLSKGLAGSQRFLSRTLWPALKRKIPGKQSTAVCGWKGNVKWPLPRLKTKPIVEDESDIKQVFDLLLWIFFAATISQDR